MDQLKIFKDYLRLQGMLQTQERLEIAGAVYALDDNFSIEDLYEKVQARGLAVATSTIYRNIKLLKAAGIIEDAPEGCAGKKGFRKIQQQKICCRLHCRDCSREHRFSNAEFEQMVLEICRKYEMEEDGIVVKIEGRRRCSCKSGLKHKGPCLGSLV